MQNTVESQYGAKIMFREWIPQALHRPPPDGRLHGADLPAALRRADPARSRSAGLARDGVVRRPHGVQDGRGRADGRDRGGHLLGMGPLRIPLDHAVPQHRRHAHRSRPARGWPRRSTCTRTSWVGPRQLPEYEEQTTFPNPWKGGWWHVRDIVEQQKVATLHALEIAAEEPGDRADATPTTRRAGRPSGGWTVEREGLRDSGRAARSAHHEEDGEQAAWPGHRRSTRRSDELHPRGPGLRRRQSYVVSMAQPKRGVIRWLLGQTYYPDNSLHPGPGRQIPSGPTTCPPTTSPSSWASARIRLGRPSKHRSPWSQAGWNLMVR